MSPWTNRIGRSGGVNSRAAASVRADASIATTSPSRPTAAARSRATSPAPAPASRSRWPGLGRRASRATARTRWISGCSAIARSTPKITSKMGSGSASMSLNAPGRRAAVVRHGPQPIGGRRYAERETAPHERASTPRVGGVTDPPLRQVFGRLLRRARLRQGRTLAEVAERARVSAQYLSEVERGRKEAVSEVLAAVCDALGSSCPTCWPRRAATSSPIAARRARPPGCELAGARAAASPVDAPPRRGAAACSPPDQLTRASAPPACGCVTTWSASPYATASSAEASGCGRCRRGSSPVGWPVCSAEDLLHLGADPGHLLGLDGQVGQRAAGLAGRLVQRHLGVPQHRPLARRAGREQHRRGRRRLAHAERGDVAAGRSASCRRSRSAR